MELPCRIARKAGNQDCQMANDVEPTRGDVCTTSFDGYLYHNTYWETLKHSNWLLRIWNNKSPWRPTKFQNQNHIVVKMKRIGQNKAGLQPISRPVEQSLLELKIAEKHFNKIWTLFEWKFNQIWRKAKEISRKKTGVAITNERSISNGLEFFIFFIWWLQIVFVAICYMYINLFALQHIAKRPGEYRTYDALQSSSMEMWA